MRKLISLLFAIMGRMVQIAIICIYLFVGSMVCVIIAGMGYGAFKETIKLYNGEKTE